MRVALLMPYRASANRGNSTAALRLARGLTGVGAAVTVVDLETEGVAPGPDGAAAAAVRLVRLLTRFAPDVVHALHGYRGGPAGVAVARALGAALVVGLRGTDVSVDLSDPVRRGYVLSACEAADAVVVFADFMLEPVLAARPALGPRCAVVPHGVDERFFSPAAGSHPPRLPEVPAGGALFLLPANIRAVKAPDLALAGLEPVAARHPGVRLALAGPVLDAALGARLEAEAGARPWVSWLGEVPHAEMPALYAAVDVVLNTSVAEGMSNAALEAMAGGRAVLLSDIPAHRAIIEPEVSGLLFEIGRPDRGAAALARQAARLVGDPPLRLRLGAAAAARARARHTVLEEARRMLAVYEAALRRHTRG